MSELSYYIIDLETTGLSSKYHEVHQIGIIRVSDRMQLVRDVKCSHPEKANYDALKISGKTINDLKLGYSNKDVVNECNKFFNEDGLTAEHRCIIGHNIWSFDRKFLQAFWQSADEEFPANLWLDTLQLVKHHSKEKGFKKVSYKLGDYCELLGIKKSERSHTAKSDTRQTYFLWMKLLDENINYLSFINKSIHSFKNNYDLSDLESLDAISDSE